MLQDMKLTEEPKEGNELQMAHIVILTKTS